MKTIRIKAAKFYAEVESEHIEELKENNGRVKEFSKQLNSELKKNNLPLLPL